MVKIQFDEFSESAAVIVDDSLCITKCLQQRIHLEMQLHVTITPATLYSAVFGSRITNHFYNETTL